MPEFIDDPQDILDDIEEHRSSAPCKWVVSVDGVILGSFDDPADAVALALEYQAKDVHIHEVAVQ